QFRSRVEFRVHNTLQDSLGRAVRQVKHQQLWKACVLTCEVELELPTYSIRISGEQVEYIALTVKGRESPGSADYWDANWLNCSVEVAAGAFRGILDSSIRTDELERFYQQVEGLNERIGGDAELATMEGWLMFGNGDDSPARRNPPASRIS